ncbi:hypothetical protein [Microbacterium sp. NPDC091662]|uniref:hypothetical protein n=1 Tax=Microbacterium sp. NPDC091662 TaxID=3364211 RepID=UPI00380F4CEC
MADVAVNYQAYVAQLQQTGSIALLQSEIPAPVDEFRRELRRAARAVGIRMRSSSREQSFIAWDPAYVVPPEALRAAMDALTILPSTQPACPVDGTMMRDEAEGWRCGDCGHQVPAPPLTREIPAFHGPTINGG